MYKYFFFYAHCCIPGEHKIMLLAFAPHKGNRVALDDPYILKLPRQRLTIPCNGDVQILSMAMGSGK